METCLVCDGAGCAICGGRPLHDGLHIDADACIKSFGDRSFDCIACGAHFQPLPDQWIFYQLCDKCFSEFDGQKMEGRLAPVLGRPVPSSYTESPTEWIKRRKRG